jgi:hypothetical protein
MYVTFKISGSSFPLQVDSGREYRTMSSSNRCGNSNRSKSKTTFTDHPECTTDLRHSRDICIYVYMDEMEDFGKRRRKRSLGLGVGK